MKLDCGHIISVLSLSLHLYTKHPPPQQQQRQREINNKGNTENKHAHQHPLPKWFVLSALLFLLSCLLLMLLVYVLVFLFSNGFIAACWSLLSECNSFPHSARLCPVITGQGLPAGASIPRAQEKKVKFCKWIHLKQYNEICFLYQLNTTTSIKHGHCSPIQEQMTHGLVLFWFEI